MRYRVTFPGPVGNLGNGVAPTLVYVDQLVGGAEAAEGQIGEQVSRYVRGIGASSSREIVAQAALLNDLAAGTGSIWAGVGSAHRRIGTFHLERLGEASPDAGPTD